MTDLTPEERQRIYLEEKTRLEIRRELELEEKREREKTSTGEKTQKVGAGWIMAVCILGVLIFLLTIVAMVENVSPPSSSSGVRTVRGTFWCAENFDDATQIGIAVNGGDTAALAGMLARGKAFQVAKGTSMVTGGDVRGISIGHIESGFQAGRDCYISTNALE